MFIKLLSTIFSKILRFFDGSWWYFKFCILRFTYVFLRVNMYIGTSWGLMRGQETLCLGISRRTPQENPNPSFLRIFKMMCMFWGGYQHVSESACKSPRSGRSSRSGAAVWELMLPKEWTLQPVESFRVGADALQGVDAPAGRELPCGSWCRPRSGRSSGSGAAVWEVMPCKASMRSLQRGHLSTQSNSSFKNTQNRSAINVTVVMFNTERCDFSLPFFSSNL